MGQKLSDMFSTIQNWKTQTCFLVSVCQNKRAFFSRKQTFKETCFIFKTRNVIHGWKACNVRLFMMFSQIFLEHPLKVQNFVVAARLKSSLKLTPCFKQNYLRTKLHILPPFYIFFLISLMSFNILFSLNTPSNNWICKEWPQRRKKWFHLAETPKLILLMLVPKM